MTSPFKVSNLRSGLSFCRQQAISLWVSAFFLLPAFFLSSRADQFDTLRLSWQNYLTSNGGSRSTIASTANGLRFSKKGSE